MSLKLVSYNIFALLLIISFSTSCKKLLEVEDTTNLSGANFWKNSKDVDNYILGIYGIFREALTKKNLSESEEQGDFPYLVFTGDLRGAPVIPGNSSSGTNERYIKFLRENKLNEFLTKTDLASLLENVDVERLKKWDDFYKVISSANIALAEIDLINDPSFSNDLRQRYKAEAVFLRCLAYFFLVRQFGDVPYYTKAYFIEKVGRSDMNFVLDMCSKELESVKDVLPWTFEDPSLIGVRAMKGSVLILLMHMNAWLASFSKNKEVYYANVIKFGDEIEKNPGIYTLIPIENSNLIFRGNSTESLFEIPQNINFDEVFNKNVFFRFVYYNPLNDKDPNLPLITYDKFYIKYLYPEDGNDDRKKFWFDRSTIYDENYKYIKFNKFYNRVGETVALNATNYTGNIIIFRYADALLLYAEALNGIQEDNKALEKVNKIRTRAQALPVNGMTGLQLKHLIFYERCRELMGEGHYWYDAVRMKMITDKNVPFGYKTTEPNFEKGCWTWPLDKKMADNNPKILFNNYWF